MAMNSERFLEEARRATERRMGAAEAIAAKLTEREAARLAFERATADVETAFKDAEAAGWGKSELRRLRPADMLPRPRKPRQSRRAETTPAPSGTNPAMQPAGHSSPITDGA